MPRVPFNREVEITENQRGSEQQQLWPVLEGSQSALVPGIVDRCAKPTLEFAEFLLAVGAKVRPFPPVVENFP
jgi:hypothetical protein